MSVLSQGIGNNKYDGVIFDLHYTIIHLFPSRGLVYQRIFKKYNFDAPPEKIKRAFSKVWHSYSDKQISEAMIKQTTEKHIEQWWFEFHYKMLKILGLSNKKIAKLINREISLQFYSNPKVHQLYKDSIKTLSFLKQRGIKMALVINGYKSTRRVVKYFRLEKYFDYIAISCELGVSKPNHKIFKLVAKELTLEPQKILCIGDNYSVDIVGTQKAGCGAALLNRKKRGFKRGNNCNYLNNLMQLKNLITYG